MSGAQREKREKEEGSSFIREEARPPFFWSDLSRKEMREQGRMCKHGKCAAKASEEEMTHAGP